MRALRALIDQHFFSLHLVCVCLGIVGGQLAVREHMLIAGILGSGGLALVGFSVWHKKKRAWIMMFLLVAGIVRGGMGEWREQKNMPTRLPDGAIALHILSQESVFDVSASYVAKIVALQTGESERVGSKVLVQLARYPPVPVGQRIRINKEMEVIDPKKSGYEKYLFDRGIYFRVKYPKIDSEWKVPKFFTEVLAEIRTTIENRINELMHEPYASLLAGLLLGTRRGFSTEFKTAMQITGTTHIIAISGYNISIIITVVLAAFSHYQRQTSVYILTSLLIGIFVIFVGAAPSVVRAGIMGWFGFTAKKLGRSLQPTYSLLLASSLMLFYAPRYILDVGFQLSFLATVGIFHIHPRIQHYFSVQTIPLEKAQLAKMYWYIQETFFLSLATQLAVLPVLLTTFDQVSLLGPIVNVLVLFMIPISMLIGALAVGVSYLWQFPASVLSWGGSLTLLYITEIIKLFAQAKFLLFGRSEFIVVLVVGIVLIAFWEIYFYRRRQQKFIKQENTCL